MKILSMIAEWRKGCKLSGRNPLECPACTERLINNIENYATVSLYSGCITPKLHLVLKRLRDALTLAQGSQNNDPKSDILVSTNDLESLLHEFFRLDTILRQKFPNTHISESEEDHRVT